MGVKKTRVRTRRLLFRGEDPESSVELILRVNEEVLEEPVVYVSTVGVEVFLTITVENVENVFKESGNLLFTRVT